MTDLPALETSFTLEPLPPFRLDYTVWSLRRRPDNIVDRWDGRTYRRVLVAGGQPFEVAVTQTATEEAPRLTVMVTSQAGLPEPRALATAALERLLGLRIDTRDFYLFGARDELIKPLAERFHGFKPPRYATFFEALVNAISCQQLTLTMGIRLVNRLAQAYGVPLETENGRYYAFPRPKDLAGADIGELRGMSFSVQKANYLTNLARAIVNEDLQLEVIEGMDDASAMSRLRELKGVGRWTAEYFLLRGLGRTHVFPGDDVGARNNLQRWLGVTEPLNYTTTNDVLKTWDGYGGMVYLHLLLKSLDEKGYLA